MPVALPALLSEIRTPDGWTGTFRVPDELPFFQGHFPGHPILPGVVALGWLLAGVERFRGQPLGPVELLNVKFQAVVLPGTSVELSVTRKPGGRWQAILQSEAGVHASALIPGQSG